ncbi:MAG: hypothetical protein R3B13_20595 [Polyangiaceae bacterium]
MILVSHREARITLVSRTAEGWADRDIAAGELLGFELQGRSVSLDVNQVYAGIRLDPA